MVCWSKDCWARFPLASNVSWNYVSRGLPVIEVGHVKVLSEWGGAKIVCRWKSFCPWSQISRYARGWLYARVTLVGILGDIYTFFNWKLFCYSWLAKSIAVLIRNNLRYNLSNCINPHDFSRKVELAFKFKQVRYIKVNLARLCLYVAGSMEWPSLTPSFLYAVPLVALFQLPNLLLCILEIVLHFHW